MGDVDLGLALLQSSSHSPSDSMIDEQCLAVCAPQISSIHDAATQLQSFCYESMPVLQLTLSLR